MIRRLVIFLVRKRLGLALYEGFQFTNQKTEAIYYFTSNEILKDDGIVIRRSSVSLNWILDDRCVIRRVDR